MSNETKQTAVQWYAERLYDLEMAYNQGVIKTNTYIKGKREAVEQAKAMEKEKMIEFAQEVFRNRYNQITQSLGNIADDIYNETYGGNK